MQRIYGKYSSNTASKIEIKVICNWFLEELYLLHQSSILDDYHDKFQELKTQIFLYQPKFHEEEYTRLSVHGLCPDIQLYVLMFNPLNVIDAYELGCIFEYFTQLESAATLFTDNVCSIVDNADSIVLTSSVAAARVDSTMQNAKPCKCVPGFNSSEQVGSLCYIFIPNDEITKGCLKLHCGISKKELTTSSTQTIQCTNSAYVNHLALYGDVLQCSSAHAKLYSAAYNSDAQYILGKGGTVSLSFNNSEVLVLQGLSLVDGTTTFNGINSEDQDKKDGTYNATFKLLGSNGQIVARVKVFSICWLVLSFTSSVRGFAGKNAHYAGYCIAKFGRLTHIYAVWPRRNDFKAAQTCSNFPVSNTIQCNMLHETRIQGVRSILCFDPGTSPTSEHYVRNESSVSTFLCQFVNFLLSCDPRAAVGTKIIALFGYICMATGAIGDNVLAFLHHRDRLVYIRTIVVDVESICAVMGFLHQTWSLLGCSFYALTLYCSCSYGGTYISILIPEVFQL